MYSLAVGQGFSGSVWSMKQLDEAVQHCIPRCGDRERGGGRGRQQ